MADDAMTINRRNRLDFPCLFYGEHRWWTIWRGEFEHLQKCSCGAERRVRVGY